MAGEKKKTKPSPSPKWSGLQGQYPGQWTGILVRINAQCMGWWGECQAPALWGRRKDRNGLYILQATIRKPFKPKTAVAAPSSETGQEQKVIPGESVAPSRHCQVKAIQGLSKQLFLSLCNSKTEATIRLLHYIDLFRGLHLLLQPRPMRTWQEQTSSQGNHSTKSTAANID